MQNNVGYIWEQDVVTRYCQIMIDGVPKRLEIGAEGGQWTRKRLTFCSCINMLRNGICIQYFKLFRE